NPNYTHSFATFVRATWQDGCPTLPPRLEGYTISWLPQTLKVRTLALHPECGVNLGLHDTIRYALDNDERVSLWGPFQIEPQLYYRALDRVAELQSGQVLYKANDTFRDAHRVSNCIHAIGEVSTGRQLTITSPAWGDTASYMLTVSL